MSVMLRVPCTGPFRPWPRWWRRSFSRKVRIDRHVQAWRPALDQAQQQVLDSIEGGTPPAGGSDLGFIVAGLIFWGK